MISAKSLGTSGPSESVSSCGDRATALIEDIWCEKIRGCCYKGGGASHSLSAMPDSDQGPQRSDMRRCANNKNIHLAPNSISNRLSRERTSGVLRGLQM